MMKNFIHSLIIFLSLIVFTKGMSQYWQERVTEESFEKSSLYFNSHYLDTYGIFDFRQVAPGLVDDPFLQLYLSPANLPVLERKNLIHLDFRGDRTEAPIISNYRIMPTYDLAVYYPNYYIDPRWYQQTRYEPEPVFSLGILAYPFKGTLRNLFMGGTYQLIYKQENFYSMPTWIYSTRYGYDVFGANAIPEQVYTVHDRSLGEDEMLNEGHLFSFFLGQNISSHLTAGLSMNGITHSRDGSYLNFQQDEYGQTNDYNWTSNHEIERDQEYRHIDITGGIQYKHSPTFQAGIKAGILSGEADQSYLKEYSHESEYDINSAWNRNESFSISRTTQSWNHDGKNWYLGINLNKSLPEGNKLTFFYRYMDSNIDLNNNSSIRDTSYYFYRWIYDTTYYSSLHTSGLSDVRSGSGERSRHIHEVMVALHMKLNEHNNLSLGFYYSRENSNILLTEPVTAERHSEYQRIYNDPYYARYTLLEEKTIKWDYESVNWTIQIPVFLNFRPNENWTLSLGFNKILRKWGISDERIAYFDIRERLEDDSLKSERYFAERYRKPEQNITEDLTDMIVRAEVIISPKFSVHFLIDPELEESFRIAQWWLGFRTSL